MTVIHPYGDVAQAAFFDVLQVHMTAIARRAEAEDPGAAHVLEMPITPPWAGREDVTAQATSYFFQAIEAIRSEA